MRITEAGAAAGAAALAWAAYASVADDIATAGHVFGVALGCCLTLAAIALGFDELTDYIARRRAALRSTNYPEVMSAVAAIGASWLPLLLLIALEVNGAARWSALAAAVTLTFLATVWAMTRVSAPTSRRRRRE